MFAETNNFAYTLGQFLCPLLIVVALYRAVKTTNPNSKAAGVVRSLGGAVLEKLFRKRN